MCGLVMFLFKSSQRVIEAVHAKYPLRVIPGDIVKFSVHIELTVQKDMTFDTKDSLMKEFARRLLYGVKV